MFKGALMRGTQDNTRGAIFLKGVLPSGCAETPAVACFQPGKAKILPRSRQVITLHFRKRQEFVGDNNAYGVTASVFGARIAAAVAEKAGHRCRGARLQRLSKHVAGRPASGAKTFRF